ncbi:hypothetical protein [Stieleria varia]|uniref:Uncharacterized protein n=1 Tax=Stieleria varia TaxID=2528005 RepID=A0A5C6ARZ0_9BACT|nr:hypothetical protein [Stieleria varia]TWU02793.1 hypothetical protein Pla52n_38520 [Stieleria varia]
MIIEDLIRTGKLLQAGGLDPRETLRLLSDVSSNQTRNFFQHVYVIELPDVESDQPPMLLEKQVWVFWFSVNWSRA